MSVVIFFVTCFEVANVTRVFWGFICFIWFHSVAIPKEDKCLDSNALVYSSKNYDHIFKVKILVFRPYHTISNFSPNKENRFFKTL